MKHNSDSDKNIGFGNLFSFYTLRAMAGLTRHLAPMGLPFLRWRVGGKPTMTRAVKKHTPSTSQEEKRNTASQEGLGVCLYRYLSLCFFIVLTLLNIGCNDLLNERVDNRTSIHTLNDMQATVRGLNPQAHYWFTEYMTDNYVFEQPPNMPIITTGSPAMQHYTFRSTQEHLNIPAWQAYYLKIQEALVVIDRATKHQASTKEKKQKNAILGTALAIKAYCNFMLVNLFAPPYEETTKTAPGIPLVKAYTGKAIERYPTVSVQEAYDAVEQDLLKALPLMDDNQWLNTKFNFNKTAVYALLARFYLFKQDWGKAVWYADSVIEVKKLDPVKVSNETLIATYKKKIEYSKKIFNPSNKSSLLPSSDTPTSLAEPFSGFYPYPIESFLKDNGRISVMDVVSVIFRALYPKKLAHFRYSPVVFPMLSVDETYYNRAEAYIRLDSLDKAKQDLGKLLSFDGYANDKWTGKLSGITHKDTLMNYLLDSKRMRFFSEGMRWFDMRRHGLPVTHKMSGGKTFSIDGTDPKAYAIKFPLGEVNFWR